MVKESDSWFCRGPGGVLLDSGAMILWSHACFVFVAPDQGTVISWAVVPASFKDNVQVPGTVVLVIDELEPSQCVVYGGIFFPEECLDTLGGNFTIVMFGVIHVKVEYLVELVKGWIGVIHSVVLCQVFIYLSVNQIQKR